MNNTRGLGQTIGPFYSSPLRPNPAYWQPQQNKALNPVPCEKKKLKNLIIQSYWVIWLLFSFIVAYLLGFLILENP